MPTDIAEQFDHVGGYRHRTSAPTFPTEADRKRLAAWRAHWESHCGNHPERAIDPEGKADRHCAECLHAARNRGAAQADAHWSDIVIEEVVKVWESNEGSTPGAGQYRYYTETKRLK